MHILSHTSWALPVWFFFHIPVKGFRVEWCTRRLFALVNSSSGARGMWDWLTYFRPQSSFSFSFSFYVHVVLSQSVRYQFISFKPHSIFIPGSFSYFKNVISINLLLWITFALMFYPWMLEEFVISTNANRSLHGLGTRKRILFFCKRHIVRQMFLIVGNFSGWEICIIRTDPIIAKAFWC